MYLKVDGSDPDFPENEERNLSILAMLTAKVQQLSVCTPPL